VTRPSALLIMIGYEIEIGYAIGRLISVFYEMGFQITGDQQRVHFSFTRLAGGRSKSLPHNFSNLVEFDYRSRTARPTSTCLNYITENKIDTVFALDMPVQGDYHQDLRKAGVKTIISYWGAPMSSINRGLKLALKRFEVEFLRRHKPDYFIFESEAMRRFGVLGRGLRHDRTTVIPTGIDAAKFKVLDQHKGVVRERFKIPESRSVVVYMGHLHRRKGVHVLMRAAEYWCNTLQRRDIHCLFLGNKPEELAQFENDYRGATDVITFGGYQSDIPELLAGCTIGCIPSSGWDSFPMSSLEMQACGLPVVVSDWQGVPETVEAGQTGIVVPTGDPVALANAVVQLVDDPERRASMSRAARARIETAFTRERQISALAYAKSKLAM
jgi:glycosyltransferase involved in cell wall biosynthesis